MPLVHSSPPPEPWRVGDRRSPALARLVGALYRHREDLIRIYPNVVLPTDPGNAPTPLAALLLLWANWDYGRGLCPACRSAAVVTSFSGVLSAGSVGGCAGGCGETIGDACPVTGRSSGGSVCAGSSGARNGMLVSSSGSTRWRIVESASYSICSALPKRISVPTACASNGVKCAGM